MNEMTVKTLALQNRETGEVSATFDCTGMSEREFGRLWDGLVIKVDFEKWQPIYTPPRDSDQTAAEWLYQTEPVGDHDHVFDLVRGRLGAALVCDSCGHYEAVNA